MKNTTHPIPLDPSTQQGSLAEHLRERGFPIAGLPEAPRDNLDEHGELEQAVLPSGPTHVAARRTTDQLTSARLFIAAAGRVKFDRGRATLKAVWMSVAYYASLGSGPERVCYAQVKTLADRALVSERTIRTHLAALAGHGLIQTDHRTGGHAPTKWSIQEVSPSVLGGKDCRAGRQELPGRAARIADEVRDVCSASTKQNVHLASKQQPDGACAPPPAARTDPPQTTNKKQPTRTAGSTQPLAPAKTDWGGITQGGATEKQPARTAEPTQLPVHTKTDRGGNTRGGATEKQIDFLHILADMVGAEPDEESWRAADSKRVQAQIKAAVPFKDLKKHTHAAFDEHFSMVGIAFGGISYKHVAQRCECGAFRSAAVTRKGVIGDAADNRWTLSGHLVEGFTWAAPMSFSEVEELTHGQA